MLDLIILLSWITQSGWIVEVTPQDLINHQHWWEIYIKSVAQMIQFIPTIAMVAWGFYILTKIFSLIKKN